MKCCGLSLIVWQISSTLVYVAGSQNPVWIFKFCSATLDLSTLSYLL
jgi:hypothetical protein